MTKELRKIHRIHVFCAVLIALFLVVVPVTSALSALGTNGGPVGAGDQLYDDPLGRLPSSPADARARLAGSGDLDAEGILALAALGRENVAGGAISADATQEILEVVVSIPNNTVYGFSQTPGATITIEYFLAGGSPLETLTVTADDDEGFFAGTFVANEIDEQGAIQLTSSEGGAAEVIECLLTGTLEIGQDLAQGTCDDAEGIAVYVRTPSTYFADTRFADTPNGLFYGFTEPTGNTWEIDLEGQLTLRGGDVAYAYKFDEKGYAVTRTIFPSSGVQPLVVYPQYDAVLGYTEPHTSLNIEAGGKSNMVGTAGDGFFEEWFYGIVDITNGTVVSAATDYLRSVTVADLVARLDPSSNFISGKGPADTSMRLVVNPYGSHEIQQGVREFTTDENGEFEFPLFQCDCRATGSDVYNIAWYDEDGDCVVYEFQTFSWHLAEGYTGGEFDTYILIQNPNDVEVDAVLTYQVQDGDADPLIVTVPAQSRMTVHLDEQPGLADASVSTKVTSVTGAPLNAERACYFNYYGMMGGHDSIGVLTPTRTWYLAEGCTWDGYDTWILVQNPGLYDAEVELSFQLGEGTADEYTFQLEAGTRQSIRLNDLPGLEDGADVSTRVTADQRVVAERAVYFNASGFNGGSDSIGVDAARKTWYLAEGCTWDGYDEWVLVQNPTGDDAEVTLSFQLGAGTAPDHEFTLYAGQRKSVKLNDLDGLKGGADVSTKVTSDVDVIAERAMYFNAGGVNGGHAANAAQDASRGWYLPEGYTGGSFVTWVLVQNPGDSAADVKMTFQLGDGTAAPHEFTLPAGKRQSVLLNDLPGLAGKDVSTTVTSDEPVIVERAQYFVYNGFPGGTCATGIPFFVRVPL